MGLSNGKKIVINTFYGLFGSNTFFRDHKAMLQVTLNNQLSLAMLIERLLMNGIEVLSANTDGIVCAFPPSMEKKYQKICASWQKFDGCELEYADYDKYIRKDVNNYMATYKESSKVKRKGVFSEPSITSGFDMPVIANAVVDHYLNGSNIVNYMTEEADVYDFCKAVKIGPVFDNFYIPSDIEIVKIGKNGKPLKHHKFEYEYKGEEEQLQNSVRFFIAREGGYLFKRHKNTAREHTHCKGRLVSVFNDFRKVDIEKEVDLPFYFEKAMEIKNTIDAGNTENDIQFNGPKICY